MTQLHFSRKWIQVLSATALGTLATINAGDASSAGQGSPALNANRLGKLASCLELATSPTGGLVGNPEVVQSSIVVNIAPPDPGGYFSGSANPNAPGGGGSVPPTPSYCNVNFTYSTGLEGPSAGYDIGQKQLIKIRVFLPLSVADGGSGGVQGNWNGKQMVGASGGSSGDHIRWASYAEGVVDDDFQYAIRLGYVGSNTDAGQNNPPFVLIGSGPLAGTLAIGTIEDWAARATHYGKRMAAVIAKSYYGTKPAKVYFNGCSGAGNMALGQLQRFGDEYDGALIGAPAIYWQQRALADAWPNLVWKKHVQQGGTIPTAAQRNAVNAAATASCDVQGLDTVADGIVADPRACTFSAKAHVCGVSGAPATNCLTSAQADAIDRIWDGPRNRYGKRIYFGKDRGLSFSLSAGNAGNQTIQWNHANPALNGSILFSDPESVALAGSPAGAMSYDDEATLGSNTVGDYSDNIGLPQDSFRKNGEHKGGKIIHIHGTQDGALFWRHSADYYRRTAVYYGNGKADYESLQSWYRFFPMPGVGHCQGGAPSAADPFLALERWVEKGQAPDSLLATQYPGVSPANRTRLLCPYPKTAVYKGSGSTEDAANYSCAGSLDTQQVVCDSVRTKFKEENKNALDFASLGVNPASCPALTP
jgi:hypothetical protein